MRSEKIPEAAFAWSEGQRCVEVQAACPVRLAAQVVTCTTFQTEQKIEPPFALFKPLYVCVLHLYLYACTVDNCK